MRELPPVSLVGSVSGPVPGLPVSSFLILFDGPVESQLGLCDPYLHKITMLGDEITLGVQQPPEGLHIVPPQFIVLVVDRLRVEDLRLGIGSGERAAHHPSRGTREQGITPTLSTLPIGFLRLSKLCERVHVPHLIITTINLGRGNHDPFGSIP